MNHSKLPPCKGFSLIELLVVVSILSVIAAATFVQLSDRDDQERYDATKDRYEALREALIGKDELATLNGVPVQSGYIYDTGRLPAALTELSDHPPGIPRWGLIGTDQLRPGLGDKFTNEIYQHIKIEHGWRGPYFVRNEQTDDTLKDAWGRDFVLNQPTNSGGIITPLQLYSLGKDGQEDTFVNSPDSPDTSPDDEKGYFLDYPSMEAKNIFEHEYTISPIPMPDTIRISISDTLVDTATERGQYFVGVLYPGIDLSDSFGLSTREALLTGFDGVSSNGSPVRGRVSFNDLIDEGTEGGNRIFRLKRSAGGDIAFQIDKARRYQIAIFRSNGVSTAQTGDSLARRLVAVHPQVFRFIAGTNPNPINQAGQVWDMERFGNPN